MVTLPLVVAAPVRSVGRAKGSSARQNVRITDNVRWLRKAEQLLVVRVEPNVPRPRVRGLHSPVGDLRVEVQRPQPRGQVPVIRAGSLGPRAVPGRLAVHVRVPRLCQLPLCRPRRSPGLCSPQLERWLPRFHVQRRALLPVQRQLPTARCHLALADRTRVGVAAASLLRLVERRPGRNKRARRRLRRRRAAVRRRDNGDRCWRGGPLHRGALNRPGVPLLHALAARGAHASAALRPRRRGERRGRGVSRAAAAVPAAPRRSLAEAAARAADAACGGRGRWAAEQPAAAGGLRRWARQPVRLRDLPLRVPVARGRAVRRAHLLPPVPSLEHRRAQGARLAEHVSRVPRPVPRLQGPPRRKRCAAEGHRGEERRGAEAGAAVGRGCFSRGRCRRRCGCRCCCRCGGASAGGSNSDGGGGGGGSAAGGRRGFRRGGDCAHWNGQAQGQGRGQCKGCGRGRGRGGERRRRRGRARGGRRRRRRRWRRRWRRLEQRRRHGRVSNCFFTSRNQSTEPSYSESAAQVT